jgi:hypothetical protein
MSRTCSLRSLWPDHYFLVKIIRLWHFARLTAWSPVVTMRNAYFNNHWRCSFSECVVGCYARSLVQIGRRFRCAYFLHHQGEGSLHTLRREYLKKGWSCRNKHHGGAWRERRYSLYSFSNSALERGEWSESRPGRALAPGRGPPVPIGQEAGWAPESVWTQRLEEKSFCLRRGSNADHPVVQSVARHYDWATPALWVPNREPQIKG